MFSPNPAIFSNETKIKYHTYFRHAVSFYSFKLYHNLLQNLQDKINYYLHLSGQNIFSI